MNFDIPIKTPVIPGASWNPPRLFPSPVIDLRSYRNFPPDQDLVVSPSKTWAYANVLLPAYRGLRNGYGGYVRFDADVVTPILYGRSTSSFSLFDACVRSSRPVWMSYTPMEIWTQRAGVRFAKGRTVVVGLGLGHLLCEVAKKPSVKELVLVEDSQELLDWYGYRRVREIEEQCGKKIEVVCADGYAYTEKDTADARYLFDIWAQKSESRYDFKLSTLFRAGKPIWAWGRGRK